ncbi:SDR family NAD(P)-dependent oxidoreductase [Streptomyces purpurogeneiscleroticus]|uniref:SDR family NAD(P)-dependent oxidoreductase n=1 Tax=Streptomyces purpurogeneiscleroticus TaxID=68259 RepID=UPI001CC1A736|nr:SDR family NAD(P)-dependent oxidoreductase [Streptomyces purpurogeneiscleroticus]MBZ4017052.1 short-chain dehydrogenase [Streptomyces purpurogeneiscleroticus]
MAKTLVVVGAGPGRGMGVARAFGRHGYRVGLVARTKDRLDAQVAELAGLDIPAAAFPADIRDRDALAAALAQVTEALGPADVLDYGPGPSGPVTHAAQTTAAAATAQFDLYVLGAITAVGQILPDMLARGSGTVLITTGAAATVPTPSLANAGLAMAALRNYAQTLHAELAPLGIHTATVTMTAPPSSPTAADTIGAAYYGIHERHTPPEALIGPTGTLTPQAPPSSQSSA